MKRSVQCEPEIDAAIVAELERLEGLHSDRLEPRLELLAEILRQDRLGLLVGICVLLPLDLGARDLRRACRQLGEVELHDRQRLGLVVAEHGDVELAAFDVLLDQGRGVELGVDVVDALHQLLDRAAYRAELDADRAVLARRLHDHRELDVVGVLGAAAEHRGEVRGVDAVEREDLLGQRLVLREVQAVRAGAGVAPPEQLQERRHVRVVAVVPRERLDQVEDQVGLGLGDLDQARRRAVEAQEHGVVAVLLERLVDFLDVLVRGLALGARLVPFLALVVFPPVVVENADAELGHVVFPFLGTRGPSPWAPGSAQDEPPARQVVHRHRGAVRRQLHEVSALLAGFRL